ncbi:MAG TPA: hypothetical protein VLH56_16875 [Dissulfurispiraceae bacterium]|nr:hypothetical protein [Dissulfurispiraceae bacterium]
MFAVLYHHLSQHLADKVPQLRQIELYNGQYLNTEDELPMALPACFIEFESVQWRDTGLHTQEGTFFIAFHLVCQHLLPTDGFHTGSYNAAQYRQVLELAQALHLALHGFVIRDDGGLIHTTELRRTTTRPDANADSLHVWVTTYQANVIDNTANRDVNRQPFIIPKVKVNRH